MAENIYDLDKDTPNSLTELQFNEQLNKYRNKLFDLVGVILDINNRSINLSLSGPSVGSIFINYNDEFRSTLLNYSKGDKVVIVGSSPRKTYGVYPIFAFNLVSIKKG